MRGTDLPALVPALGLHRALAADDQDALVEILRHRPADFTGLTDAALAALDADHAHDPALRHLRAATDDRGSRWEALSAREQEIAAGVSAGRTNRELADAFHLSVRTVESHVSHILRKLGLTNRAEIERYVAAEHH
nr:helix-turn-helix transcriptional regulator [Cellulomonas denverensis]